jgi:hypothetical protein
MLQYTQILEKHLSDMLILKRLERQKMYKPSGETKLRSQNWPWLPGFEGY